MSDIEPTPLEDSLPRKSLARWAYVSKLAYRLTLLYLLSLMLFLASDVLVGEQLWLVAIGNYVLHCLILPAILILPILIWRRRWILTLFASLAALIFIVIFGGYIISSLNPPSTGPVDLRVMTYNLGNDVSHPDTLIPVLRASGAQIIALEELSTENAVAIKRDLLDLYPYQILYGEGIPGKGIISQWPILAHERLPFVPERQDLKAMIDFNGQPIQVIAAHPTPPRIHRTGVYMNVQTVNQIYELIRLAKSDPFTIMMGDFNITERNSLYHHILMSGLSDSFAEVGRGFGFTVPRRMGVFPTLPVMRIDYVFISNTWQAVNAWVGEDGGSDHLPLVVDLRWLGPQAPNN